MDGYDDRPLRTFIAVDMPSEIKEKLYSAVKGLPSRAIRPVAIDNMHITLFFLGMVRNADIEKIRDLIDGLDHGPFRVSVSGIGAFSAKHPRILFAGVSDGREELKIIYRSLSGGIRDLGIAIDDKEYLPHITVARIRKSGNNGIINSFINENSGRDFGSFVCDSVKLKGSTLTGAGPIYTDIHAARFRQQGKL